MVEESFLPMRLLNSKPEQFFPAPSLMPRSILKASARHWKRDEQMDVIRHEDIAADCNVVFLCSNAKRDKDIVDLVACQKERRWCVLNVTK